MVRNLKLKAFRQRCKQPERRYQRPRLQEAGHGRPRCTREIKQIVKFGKAKRHPVDHRAVLD